MKMSQVMTANRQDSTPMRERFILPSELVEKIGTEVNLTPNLIHVDICLLMAYGVVIY